MTLTDLRTRVGIKNLNYQEKQDIRLKTSNK